MGGIETAAWDPIFWLHHCNIDRIWAAWTSRQPQSNAGPDVDTNWKNEAFVFMTPKGQTLWHAEMALQTTGYQYDSLVITGAPAVPPPPKKPPVVQTTPSPHGMTPEALSPPKSVAITSAGGTIVLALSGAGAKNKLNAMALGGDKPPAAGAPTNLRIVLDGLRITNEGQRRALNFDVQVVVPPKPGAAAVPITIGSINKFRLSGRDSSKALRFDITEAVRAAAKGTSVTPSSVEVILLPRRLLNADRTPRDPSPSGSLIQFDSVHVEASTDQ